VSDLQPRDSFVTDPTELRRLTGQSAAILARLKQGPATARELSALALKYTGRISDLREAGYVITCEDDPVTGKSRYRLIEEPQPTPTSGPHDLNVAQPGRLL
jgi:hypothetical protein